MFKLGGDDVLADMPRSVRNPLDGKVVGFAGAGGVDDFGGLHTQTLRNGLGHAFHLGACLLPGYMGGVGVGYIAALRCHIGVQDLRICRGVGRVIKINHRLAS